MEASNLRDLSDRLGFASTHWTTVRACASKGEAAAIAREELCRDYWYPLYAYIKRSGLHDDDAEDLTQAFFAEILGRPWFAKADQSKGKFRSFLLASLNHFLHNETDRKRASKRGWAYQHVPLDMSSAESRFAQNALTGVDFAKTYEVEWAVTVVAAALKRLKGEYVANGREAHFASLKIFLTTDGDTAIYDAAAAILETSVGNVRACVHRLRRGYGSILREEVARTVAAPEDIAGEVQHLREIMAAI